MRGLLLMASPALGESLERLGSHDIEVDANWAAFAVIFLSLAVDTVRWRLLSHIARETRSEAIAADALHYASDLVSSVCVLIGLGASRFGFVYGDALAALGVSVFIAYTGYHLGRKTIDALVDAAPKGMMAEVRNFARSAEGIAGVDFLRLRTAGPHVVGDLGVFVSRTLPIARVAEIKADLAAGLNARWPDLNVTLIANPLALDDETILERVLLTAARRKLAVHHVGVQHFGEHTSVTLDLELDGALAHGEAHAIASKLEAAIRAEVGAEVEVETHIEPLETHELAGREADAEFTRRFTETLSRLAARDGKLLDIHKVRLRVAEGRGYYGLFHCRVPPQTTVAAAHAEVDALERAARSEMPELARVVGHVEPSYT